MVERTRPERRVVNTVTEVLASFFEGAHGIDMKNFALSTIRAIRPGGLAINIGVPSRVVRQPPPEGPPWPALQCSGKDLRLMLSIK